jgi:hypothetical protein
MSTKRMKMRTILLTLGAHALLLSLDSLWVALVGGEVTSSAFVIHKLFLFLFFTYLLGCVALVRAWEGGRSAGDALVRAWEGHSAGDALGGGGGVLEVMVG